MKPPVRSNLLREFLIGYVVVICASIVGRLAGGGELDAAFLVKNVIGYGIVLSIVFGIVSLVRAAGHTNETQHKAQPASRLDPPMNENQHIDDALYHQVGLEMSKNDYQPGPMARAVATANGDRQKVESLYIAFRFEELKRQTESEIGQRQLESKLRDGLINCPSCGEWGKPETYERGNSIGHALIGLVLCFPFIIPGIVYWAWAVRTFQRCPHCKAKIQ